jgi:hypothetical protein
MSTYSLSGTGIQALSAGVTAVHVDVTTVPTNSRVGTSNPANLYDVAMLRWGDASAFFDALPVVGGPQWIAVPAGATRLGYACKGGAVISVVEIIGGTPPFGGPGALSGLSDVAIASPTNAQVLTYQSSSSKWINQAAAGGGGGLYSAYLCYQDQKASGTVSGTFTAGAWQTRTLNTELVDTAGLGSLSANQITLPLGSYQVLARAPANGVGTNQARLRNVTDGATLVTGENSYSNGNGDLCIATVAGAFSLSATKAVELQHYCTTTKATNGLGIEVGGGIPGTIEIYATVELWKFV